jgi:CheY-like chemotaxis protein
MLKRSTKVLLVVEDNPGDARILREMLKEQGSHGIELIHVECMADAEAHLAAHPVDMILLDLGLPDAQGLGAVRRVRAAAPHLPLVVLTGLDDEALAAQTLHEGRSVMPSHARRSKTSCARRRRWKLSGN